MEHHGGLEKKNRFSPTAWASPGRSFFFWPARYPRAKGGYFQREEPLPEQDEEEAKPWTIVGTGFLGGAWTERIDVRDFIQRNYTPYEGDAGFLAGATARTKALNEKYLALREQELQKGGVLDIDTEHVSSLLNYGPGYLDKDNELIVGLQTEKPLLPLG